jgi:hypothetical protein
VGNPASTILIAGCWKPTMNNLTTIASGMLSGKWPA